MNFTMFVLLQRKFYGPTERWMLFSALLRAKVWMNIISNRQSGVKGNMIGEGRILGGVCCLSSRLSSFVLFLYDHAIYYVDTHILSEVCETYSQVCWYKEVQDGLFTASQ